MEVENCSIPNFNPTESAKKDISDVLQILKLYCFFQKMEKWKKSHSSLFGDQILVIHFTIEKFGND